MAIDPQFLVTLGKGADARQYPLYAGILAEAHRRGLGSVETQLIQAPTEENGQTAIVKAVVKMYPGLGGEEFSDRPPPYRTFEAYGDASPKNVNPRIATALLRMAETRAKGRALRDAIDCGMTMLEELPDLEEHAASTARTNGHQTPHAAARAREATPGSTAGSSPAKTGFEKTYSEAGTRQYTREELIQGTRKRISQALELGIEVAAVSLEETRNKELFALAERLTEQIKESKAAAQAHELAAETS